MQSIDDRQSWMVTSYMASFGEAIRASDSSPQLAQSDQAQQTVPSDTSFDDLQNQADQIRAARGAQPQQAQQPQPQQYSPENPFSRMVSNYAQQVQASALKPHESGFKNLLRSFLTGSGEAMMMRAGLTRPAFS